MTLMIDKIKDSETLGRGKLRFKETGRNAYLDMGEVEDFKYNMAPEFVDKNTMRESVATEIAHILKNVKLTGSFSVSTPILEILRFFGLGDAVEDQTQTGSTFDSAFTVYHHDWVDLGKVSLTAIIVYRTAGKDFTADAGTNVCSSTTHGFMDGDKVVLTNSGGALPAGLSANTVYYIRDKATSTFKLAATSAGTEIDITGAGTGTHTAHLVYTLDTDYEVEADTGWLRALSTGVIADAESLKVSATYATVAMTSMQLATLPDIEGDLIFLGNPPHGITQDFLAHVKLAPNGDFSAIGEDLQKFEITFTALLSSARRGLAEVRDRSGKSRIIAALS